MKKITVLFAGLLGIASLASAAIVNCSTITNLSQLTVDNAGVGNGCVDQDKEYTNFVYNPTGGVDPSAVAVGISFGTVGTEELHVIALQAGAVGWTSQFVLSYTLEVNDPMRFINGIELDATFLGAGLGNVSQSNSPAGAVDPIVAVLATSGETTHSTSLLNVVVTGSPGAGSSIQQFATTYTQGLVIPEPATYALFGAGLLGMAFFRRRPS